MLLFLSILTCFVGNLCQSAIIVPLNDKKSFVFNQYMAPCSRKKLPTRYENWKFSTSAGKFYADYDFIVDKDIQTDMIFFKFKRCLSAENLDSCTSFPPMKTSNFCRMMNSDDQVWSQMLKCARPRIPCPFRKGTYHGRNCSLDMNAFKFFPLGSSYWYLDTEIYNDKKAMVFCNRCSGTLRNNV